MLLVKWQNIQEKVQIGQNLKKFPANSLPAGKSHPKSAPRIAPDRDASHIRASSVSRNRLCLGEHLANRRKMGDKIAVKVFIFRYLGGWRSDRDSNPGDGLPPTHFPGVRLRPLGHRSVEARCNAETTGFARDKLRKPFTPVQLSRCR